MDSGAKKGGSQGPVKKGKGGGLPTAKVKNVKGTALGPKTTNRGNR